MRDPSPAGARGAGFQPRARCWFGSGAHSSTSYAGRSAVQERHGQLPS